MRRLFPVVVLLLAGCSAQSGGPAASRVPESTTPASPVSSAPLAPEASTTQPVGPAPKEKPVATEDQRKSILLVNKENTLSSTYVPKSVGKWGLTGETDAAVRKLIAAAQADGVPMQVRSGYRSYASQKAGYEEALRTYPEEKAKQFHAPPGASEHQTGLSADMWDGKNRGDAFHGTPTDTWLSQNAYKFGFIIRYPEGKEYITGYAYEPWHIRYVGEEVAAKFGPANTLTLEEFLSKS